MDPIFKNKTHLKKEYENLHKNILPILNECGNCNKFKCNYCLKFSVNCNLCIKTKCKNCYEFNKSKDILLNCGIFQIELYVRNFLFDYFNTNDLTKEFFKMNISEKMQQKNPLYIYDGKIKKIFHYNQSCTNKKIQYEFKGHKRCFYFKK